jgi:hypothetical protein
MNFSYIAEARVKHTSFIEFFFTKNRAVFYRQNANWTQKTLVDTSDLHSPQQWIEVSCKKPLEHQWVDMQFDVARVLMGCSTVKLQPIFPILQPDDLQVYNEQQDYQLSLFGVLRHRQHLHDPYEKTLVRPRQQYMPVARPSNHTSVSMCRAERPGQLEQTTRTR